MIDIIQKIIKDYNPNINVSVGSPLYMLLCTPAAEVFTEINKKIEELDSNSSILTATNKSPLIANFGIPPIAGSKGTGELTISIGLSSYLIPKGTKFVASDNTIIVSIEDCISPNTVIKVETELNTSKVYPIGTTFTTDIYGNLITSIVVTKDISNGTEDETEENYLNRIYNLLYINPTTESGIKYILNNTFSDIIDVKINTGISSVSMPRGINIDILMKLPILQKNATLEYPYILNDIVLESNVKVLSKKNKLTAYESNQFDTSNISYTSVDIKSKQEVINSVMPLGINGIAVQAEPVYISGNINFYDGASINADLTSFINNYKLEPFYMNKLLALLTNYKLPVKLMFNEVEITDVYDSSVSAYYYDRIW